MIWNPSPHMKHAWQEASSIYAKIALLLFYTFVWVSIVLCIWSVIDPASQNISCLLDAMDETAATSTRCLIRGINVVMIGLLGYADVGGAHVKNIAYLFVIVLAYILVLTPFVPMSQDLGCENMTILQMLIYPGFLGVALVFALIDKYRAGGGTAAERAPLNV